MALDTKLRRKAIIRYRVWHAQTSEGVAKLEQFNHDGPKVVLVIQACLH